MQPKIQKELNTAQKSSSPSEVGRSPHSSVISQSQHGITYLPSLRPTLMGLKLKSRSGLNAALEYLVWSDRCSALAAGEGLQSTW